MSQAKAILSWLAQVASGTPAHEISLSTILHAPKSSLEMPVEQRFSNAKALLDLHSIQFEEDALQRIAKLIRVLMDPHTVWTTSKAMTPLLGEFYKTSAVIEGNEFGIELECVSANPPMTCYRLRGPGFEFGPKEATGEGHHSVGFGYLDISQPSKVGIYSSETHQLEFQMPAFRVEKLLSSKRECGLHGDFHVKDSQSGIQFVGKMVKPLKLIGNLIDGNGVIMDKVDGDIIKGIILNNSKTVWFKAIDFAPLELIYDQDTLNDELFSLNLWGPVFEKMKEGDVAGADAEKALVEERGRHLHQQYPSFSSRFHFKSI